MAKRPQKRVARAGETRARVLELVRERVLAGLPPTVREVQEAFGFRAIESAREHLEKLVAEGRLEKTPGIARGYRLPGTAPHPGSLRRSSAHQVLVRSTRPTSISRDRAFVPVAVPLLGRVPAGPLAEAIEDCDGWIAAEMRGGAELFALVARGDSMSGAGIESGDVLVVRAQASADDGEIVVARVGGEATVKRLRSRRGRVTLVAENPAYAPIEVDPASDFAILGRVVEVRRVLDRR